jgi:hypothetical protein
MLSRAFIEVKRLLRWAVGPIDGSRECAAAARGLFGANGRAASGGVSLY